jgi:uncharacterized repeat protein (TIGR01451 family)
MLTIFTRKVTVVTILLALVTLSAASQNILRPFNLVYSDNIKGGTTMLGNTVLRASDVTAMDNVTNGTTAFGNDDFSMVAVDIDGDPTTANSSSADLNLPAGINVIKFARLYWGGRVLGNLRPTNALIVDSLRKVKFRKGTTGAYSNINTAAINVDTFAIADQKVYQAYVDVTSFINANGAGTYTVANVPCSPGTGGTGGRYGGWTLVVAYENQSLPYNSVRVYDGYAQVFNNGSPSTLTLVLNGLNVPNNPLAMDEASLGTMSWEGDGDLAGSGANPQGDFIKVNGFAVSNAVNPSANFWNSSISKNGAYVTTKNPNYKNQMGIDIDEVNVGTGYNIQPNATSVTVQFGTEADQYFPSIFTFSIRMKDPLVIIDKRVNDANNNTFVESNEELTYTLSGQNQGVASAYNTFIIDSLPANVTYVPNSLEVISAPGVTAGFKTDAADGDVAVKGQNGARHYVKFYIGIGATGTNGGELPSGATYSVRFKVKANAIPGTINNTARIVSNSQAGDLFTDDGSAVIGQAGGPVPVKFTSFKAQLLTSNSAIVKWTTESELDNDHFEVERSDDGLHFTLRGKVRGNGSTTVSHSYDYTDMLNTSSPIVYYRLKIIDTDGKYSYSKIVAIKLSGSINVDKYSVYPNPFISDIRISMTSQIDVMATFRVLSFDGKEMVRRTLSVQKGDNIIVMKDFGKLAKGSYLLEVTSGSDKFIQKIVKD